MTQYQDLYHVVVWHKDGTSSYGKGEDYGFHYKGELTRIIHQALSDLPYEDYLQIEKLRFTVSTKQRGEKE